ncbi:MAG: hypothetical protein Q4F28_02570 [Eubacteriales bacterium]|nr:hypothetical protein [Eubacteriales bacterium]
MNNRKTPRKVNTSATHQLDERLMYFITTKAIEFIGVVTNSAIVVYVGEDDTGEYVWFYADTE